MQRNPGIWQHLHATPHQLRWIDAGGVRTRMLEAGQPDAPPLLLLHGTAGSLENFCANIATFAAHFRVIAIDMLGCGLTDKPRLRLPHPGLCGPRDECSGHAGPASGSRRGRFPGRLGGRSHGAGPSRKSAPPGPGGTGGHRRRRGRGTAFCRRRAPAALQCRQHAHLGDSVQGHAGPGAGPLHAVRRPDRDPAGDLPAASNGGRDAPAAGVQPGRPGTDRGAMAVPAHADPGVCRSRRAEHVPEERPRHCLAGTPGRSGRDSRL